ncbi:MAG: PQQ-dependent sugar dehydrogenase [Bacteroidota bacterium]
MTRSILLLLFFISVGLMSCSDSEETASKPPLNTEIYTAGLPLDKIKLPEGFKITVFADSVENARSMALSPNGTLFVGTRGAGNVYALTDKNGDMRADTVYTLAEGLKLPNGVAFKDGDLYVAEVNRIIKWTDIESKLENPGEPEIIFDQYPTETHHGWKYIAFGPDDKLYVPVGAPCNICKSEDKVFASITRLNQDGTGMEVIQHGIRNTVGFTWHPTTEELWFTDNGRDWLGDDIPACELNRATQENMHFGYPYCHQGDLQDEEFGDQGDCADFTPPIQNLGAHVAPLGLEFVTSSLFPDSYKNQILIAEHGSWNRSKKSGYVVSMVTLDDQFNSTSYEAFAEGWLDQEADEAWGRPVDLEFLPDGSILVSDDFADVIYRIFYEG